MNDNHLLDALTRQGVLISVSCRYWRAAKKLQAADLGLDPDDVAEHLISLGHKRLLPRDALAAFALIESRTAEEYRDNTGARRRLDAGIRGLADEARRSAHSDASEIVERFGQIGVRKFTLAA